MLKIQGLDINKINGIGNLKIQFNPFLNIICGANGVGKTTILECIHDALKSNERINIRLKKNLVWGKSGYYIYGESDFGNYFKERDLDIEKRYVDGKTGKEFLYFNIFRTQYNNFWGNKFTYVVNWFGKNYLKENLDVSEYDDLRLAIQCFNKLDSSIKFSRVKVKDNIRKGNYVTHRNNIPNFEILVETIDGELNLTDLSSGYLSCLIIFLEIIKKATECGSFNKNINEFDGVILIDEIDLHLHPEWQKKVLDILRWLVPNAQIIVTTHSPHIVQSAERGEVISIKNVSGNCEAIVHKSNSNYGYQGWTIEEILEDVMGLKSTRSTLYSELVSNIEHAIDTLDGKSAELYLNKLKIFLHPNNPIGKILSLQVASIRGYKYD
ncbi:AAA family ATPase [Lysinibacillus sp. FSL L8-0126]|uniref:AAA family ATPase n=1 Tax=Lysinibacillus sp. FSL L8-0126 TaxID=2921515 RepID=UPI00315A812C